MKTRDALNLMSLTSIQVSNALVPILVFPFVLTIVGADLYAKIAISEAITFITLTVVLYSFEINGVSSLVGLDLKRDREQISIIFSSIFIARLLLLFFCVLALAILGMFIEKKLFMLLMLWMMLPLSFIFQSSFLYQGLERNAPVAVFTVFSRVLCVLLIFELINDADDYYLVPIIIGVSYLLGGAASFVYVMMVLDVRLKIISLVGIGKYMLEGKEIFFGNLSVIFYRDFNVLILSVLSSSSVAIATYSIAEKFIKAMQATMRPLNMLFYPKVVGLLRGHERPSAKTFFIIGKLTSIQLLLLLLMVICLGLFYFTIGKDYIAEEARKNLDVIEFMFACMLPSIFFGIANFMFGTAGLNNLNVRGYYAKALFTVALVNVVLCAFLVLLLDATGAAICFVIGEILLFSLIAYRYFRVPLSELAFTHRVK